MYIVYIHIYKYLYRYTSVCIRIYIYVCICNMHTFEWYFNYLQVNATVIGPNKEINYNKNTKYK